MVNFCFYFGKKSRIKTKISYFWNATLFKKKLSTAHAEKMENLEVKLKSLEEALNKCNKEIDACVWNYTLGTLSAQDYFKQLGGIDKVVVMKPQIPRGMVDAAEFIAREHALNTPPVSVPYLPAEKLRLAEIQAKIQGYEKLDDNPYMQSRVQSEMQKLHCESSRLKASIHEITVRQTQEKWAYLMQDGGLVVINGNGFQKDLSALLQTKLELTFSHRNFIAKQVLLEMQDCGPVSASADAPTALNKNKDLVQSINTFAAQSQAKICEVLLLDPTGHMGAASSLLLPLRHQYSWHKYFPCLVSKIPQGFPSNGCLTQFLLELREAVENERAAAIASAMD